MEDVNPGFSKAGMTPRFNADGTPMASSEG